MSLKTAIPSGRHTARQNCNRIDDCEGLGGFNRKERREHKEVRSINRKEPGGFNRKERRDLKEISQEFHSSSLRSLRSFAANRSEPGDINHKEHKEHKVGESEFLSQCSVIAFSAFFAVNSSPLPDRFADSPIRPRIAFYSLKLRRWLTGLIGAFCVLAGIGGASGSGIDPVYEAKLKIISQLALFTKWPPEALSANTNEFVFGVLGENPFGQGLNVLKGQKIKGRPIVIRAFNSVEQAANCHMLFICSSEKNKMTEILKQLEGRSILTISELESGFKGIFNFVLTEADGFNRVKVEWQIDRDAVKKAGLEIPVPFYQKAR